MIKLRLKTALIIVIVLAAMFSLLGDKTVSAISATQSFSGHLDNQSTTIGATWTIDGVLYENFMSTGNFSSTLGNGTSVGYGQLSLNPQTGAGMVDVYAIYTVNVGPNGSGTFYGNVWQIFYGIAPGILGTYGQVSITGGTGPFLDLKAVLSVNGVFTSTGGSTDLTGTIYWP
jgi:hypothetical protein